MTWRFDPRSLRTLEAVARLGSFAAAAEELSYTQSAISQQLAELERRVGTRVVTRRPVRVTEAGRVLLETEAAISASLSRAATELDALADGVIGEVRLGSFISAGATLAAPALARLRSEHPGLRFTLRELEQHEVFPALLRGELDLAITFDYRHDPMTAPAGITLTPLMDDPIMAVLPADHPLARGASLDPAAVAADAWIHTEVNDAGLADAADAVRSLDFAGGDFRTALSLVAAGLGIALLPQLLLYDAPPGVVVLPLREPVLVRRLSTCRLDTRGVARPVARLEAYLRRAAVDLAAREAS